MADSSRDLTEGSIWRQLVRFCVPVLMGNIFYQLYSVADGIIAGQVLGSEALAAISATDSISTMFLNGTLGVCNGFAIVIGQAFGSHDTREVRKYFASSIVLWLVLSVVIGTVTGVLAPQMLALLSTPPEIAPRAAAYIRTRFFGIPLISFYNLIYYVFCSLGDSKTPFLLQVFTNVMNIIMDVVCMMMLKLDTFGAGLSSLIAVVMGIVLAMVILQKRFPVLHLEKSDFAPQSRRIRKLLATGIPFGLQTAVVAAGSAVFTTAVNRQGTLYVAATAAAGKIQSVFICVFDALLSFTISFVGQNTGAQKMDRVKKGILNISTVGAVWCAICVIITLAFGRQLTGMFISSSEANSAVAISAAAKFLLVHTCAFVFVMAVNVLRPAVQSMGYSFVAMFAGVMEVIGRCAVCLGLAPKYGYNAIMFADCAAWLLAVAFLLPVLIVSFRKKAAQAKVIAIQE